MKDIWKNYFKALGNLTILAVIFSSLLILLLATICFISGTGLNLYENNLVIAWIEFILIFITLIVITRQLYLVTKNG